MEAVDSRASTGCKADPELVEVHGKVSGFQPASDYVLISRLKAVENSGGIVRPEAYIELAERGVVMKVGPKAKEVPEFSIAKFSKYGAEEIHFDDEGTDRFCLVRVPDIRGWHDASS